MEIGLQQSMQQCLILLQPKHLPGLHKNTYPLIALFKKHAQYVCIIIVTPSVPREREFLVFTIPVGLVH